MSTLPLYEVYLERRAEQDLKRLSVRNFHRIITHIKALADNPRPTGCRKISGSVHSPSPDEGLDCRCEGFEVHLFSQASRDYYLRHLWHLHVCHHIVLEETV